MRPVTGNPIIVKTKFHNFLPVESFIFFPVSFVFYNNDVVARLEKTTFFIYWDRIGSSYILQEAYNKPIFPFRVSVAI